jgi:hypothetical protein
MMPFINQDSVLRMGSILERITIHSCWLCRGLTLSFKKKNYDFKENRKDRTESSPKWASCRNSATG